MESAQGAARNLALDGLGYWASALFANDLGDDDMQDATPHASEDHLSSLPPASYAGDYSAYPYSALLLDGVFLGRYLTSSGVRQDIRLVVESDRSLLRQSFDRLRVRVDALQNLARGTPSAGPQSASPFPSTFS